MDSNKLVTGSQKVDVIVKTLYHEVTSLERWIRNVDEEGALKSTLLTDADHSGYKHLLLTSLVAETAGSRQLKKPVSLAQESYQQDIVIRAVQNMLRRGGAGSNVLSFGFGPRTGNPKALVTFAHDIEYRYPNSSFSRVQYSAWKTLLTRIGDMLMGHLLEHTSIFILLAKPAVYQQITGKPVYQLKSFSAGSFCTASLYPPHTVGKQKSWKKTKSKKRRDRQCGQYHFEQCPSTVKGDNNAQSSHKQPDPVHSHQKVKSQAIHSRKRTSSSNYCMPQSKRRKKHTNNDFEGFVLKSQNVEEEYVFSNSRTYVTCSKSSNSHATSSSPPSVYCDKSSHSSVNSGCKSSNSHATSSSPPSVYCDKSSHSSVNSGCKSSNSHATSPPSVYCDKSSHSSVNSGCKSSNSHATSPPSVYCDKSSHSSVNSGCKSSNSHATSPPSVYCDKSSHSSVNSGCKKPHEQGRNQEMVDSGHSFDCPLSLTVIPETSESSAEIIDHQSVNSGSVLRVDGELLPSKTKRQRKRLRAKKKKKHQIQCTTSSVPYQYHKYLPWRSLMYGKWLREKFHPNFSLAGYSVSEGGAMDLLTSVFMRNDVGGNVPDSELCLQPSQPLQDQGEQSVGGNVSESELCLQPSQPLQDQGEQSVGGNVPESELCLQPSLALQNQGEQSGCTAGQTLIEVPAGNIIQKDSKLGTGQQTFMPEVPCHGNDQKASKLHNDSQLLVVKENNPRTQQIDDSENNEVFAFESRTRMNEQIDDSKNNEVFAFESRTRMNENGSVNAHLMTVDRHAASTVNSSSTAISAVKHWSSHTCSAVTWRTDDRSIEPQISCDVQSACVSNTDSSPTPEFVISSYSSETFTINASTDSSPQIICESLSSPPNTEFSVNPNNPIAVTYNTVDKASDEIDLMDFNFKSPTLDSTDKGCQKISLSTDVNQHWQSSASGKHELRENVSHAVDKLAPHMCTHDTCMKDTSQMNSLELTRISNIHTETLPLFHQILLNHRKCPHWALVNHHCCSKYDRLKTKLSKQSFCREAGRKDVLGATGNRKETIGGRFQVPACRKQLPTAKLLENHISHNQVFGFLKAVIKQTIPMLLFGSSANRALFLKNVQRLVSLGKFETLCLGQVMRGVKVQKCSWLKKVACQKERELRMAQLLWWIIVGLIFPVIRAFFYLTDTSTFRNRVFYFRKSMWLKLQMRAMHQFKREANLQRISAEKVREMLSSGQALGTCVLRFLPKDRGLRPIVNMSTRPRHAGQQKKSVNQQLMSLFQALTCEKALNANLCGCSVFGLDDIFTRLRQFKQSRAGSGDDRCLYFVKTDVGKCFDSIKQQMLFSIVKDILTRMGEQTYITRKYATVHLAGHKLKRVFRSDTTRMTDYQPDFASFVRKQCSDDVLTDIIVVDQVLFQQETTTSLLQVLSFHLFNNIIKVGRAHYRQGCGLSQGSVVSSLLASIYLAQLEMKHLTLCSDELLLRWMDDFLFITPYKDNAVRFLDTMVKGFPDYNCFVNVDKILTNFAVTLPSLSSIKHIESGDTFTWCGLLISTDLLQVAVDYSRYSGLSVSDTTTFDTSYKAGQTLISKLIMSLKIKCHIIFFDPILNSPERSVVNVHLMLLYVAQLFHTFVTQMPAAHRVLSNPAFFANTVEMVSRFLHHLMTRKLKTAKCEYQSPLHLDMLKWLTADAFLQRLHRFPGYKPLLTFLRSRKTSVQKKLSKAEVTSLMEVSYTGTKLDSDVLLLGSVPRT